MFAYHNSREQDYRRPFGAAEAGGTVFLALDVTGAPPELRCGLTLWRDGGAAEVLPAQRGEQDGKARFSVSFGAPDEGTLLWYYFTLDDGRGRVFYYGRNDRGPGGEGRLSETPPPPYQITVFEKDDAPAWFRNAVAYQIFPDRFFRGRDWERRAENARRPETWRGPARVLQESWRDTPFYTRNEKGEVTRWPFFGGTLEGVREKLLYLKSLGVRAVYLNPIFEASSNHKYDTADYFKIDPGFGDGESFAALARDARALGIRLILDGVFDHTGADSVYFNRYGNYGGPGACQGEKSPYFGWYRFRRFPEEYDSWWGVADLPKIDKRDRTFRDFICGEDGVVRRWMRAGAGGWRLDVADELPDDFIRDIRVALAAERPDGVLLGEVWEDASNKVSYGVRRTYLLGRALHGTTGYPFRTAALDYLLERSTAGEFSERLTVLQENYPPAAFAAALNLIGSHDTVRALTVLGAPPEGLGDVRKAYYTLPPDRYPLAVRRLKLLALLQFSVPGVPCVYYGDEAGLQGFEDPYNRAGFPWGRENGELLGHYRTLAMLRAQYGPLREGTFRIRELSECVCLVSRRLKDEEIAVLVNGGTAREETVTLPADAGYALELLRSEELRPEDGTLKLTLEPLSARVLCLRKDPPEAFRLSRLAGVLCAIGSVPSAAPGRVTVRDACGFVDFLAESGQKLWQLLPLNPPGTGGSPFYSPALFALGPRPEGEGEPAGEEELEEFCRDNAYWLDDYALYAALKGKNGGKPWQEWPEAERERRDPEQLRRENGDAVRFFRKEQFARQRSWDRVRAYAGGRSVRILGDLPIYPAPDSADVWTHRDLFCLDGRGDPALRAGVPPDYFSPEGQDWGNPLYDWEGAEKALYLWWEQRFRRALGLYDAVRVDHFRAFSAYFAIPKGARPREGQWLFGPGPAFFREMRARLGGLPVIAEDLGVQDAGVSNLLKLSGLPGMKVWQFSAGEMEHMPASEAAGRVFYSGTHDNETLVSWCASTFPGKDPASEADAILEKLYRLPAPWVIVPLQDLLLLPDSARMNTPGTVSGNWGWRADGALLTPALREKLQRRARESGR